MEEEFAEQKNGKSYCGFLGKGHKRQYKMFVEQRKKFCKEQKNDLQSTSIAEGTKFLLLLYKKGLGCSTINTARGMLSAILKKIDNIEFGKHSIDCHKNVKRNFPKQASFTKIYCNIRCRYSPTVPLVFTTMERNLPEIVNP